VDGGKEGGFAAEKVLKWRGKTNSDRYNRVQTMAAEKGERL